MRPWYKKKRFILPLALVVIIVIASASGGGGGGGDSETASDSNTAPASTQPSAKVTDKSEAADDEETVDAEPTKTPTAKAIPVEAGELLKSFEDNELAADAKYKGKTLKITGVVDKIDTDMFDGDKYVLRLASGGEYEFLTVNCNDMSTEELATINKGDTVTVLGDFDDGGDLGVEVKDCSLV